MGVFGVASTEGSISAGSLPTRKIVDHFKILAKQNAGLPRQIADFVATGEQSSVRLKLQNTSMQQAWGARIQRYSPHDESSLFTHLKDWRVDQMVRFGEVLSDLEPITYEWGFFGTKKSPDWIRHVVRQWLGHGRKDQPVKTLHDIAKLGGGGMPEVLDITFSRDAVNYGTNNSISRFSGVPELLVAERDAVLASIDSAVADVRAELAASIGRFGLQMPFSSMLLDAAIGSSKKVRSSARQALTGGEAAELAVLIEERFAKASPSQRSELVEVAATTLGAAAPALLSKLRDGETSAKVLAAFDRTAGATLSSDSKQEVEIRPDTDQGYTAVDGAWVELPPLDDEPQATKLDRAVLKLLDPAAAEFNVQLALGKKEAGKVQWHWSKQFSPIDSQKLENLAKLAEGSYKVSSNQTAIDWLRYQQIKHPEFEQFLDDHRVSL